MEPSFLKDKAMLIIHKKQMKALQATLLEQFVQRIFERIRTEVTNGANGKSDDDLRVLVYEGIKKAESYDITGESDVEDFIGCMVRYGIDFDTDPQTAWAGEILNDPSLHASEKMDHIADFETFELE